eukprot:40762_1
MALNMNSKGDINLNVDGNMVATYDNHSINNISHDNHSINHTNNSHDNTYIENHNVYHIHIHDTMDHNSSFTHNTNTPTTSKAPTIHRTIPTVSSHIPTNNPSHISNTNRKRKRKQISIIDDSFVEPLSTKRIKLNSGKSNHNKNTNDKISNTNNNNNDNTRDTETKTTPKIKERFSNILSHAKSNNGLVSIDCCKKLLQEIDELRNKYEILEEKYDTLQFDYGEIHNQFDNLENDYRLLENSLKK